MLRSQRLPILRSASGRLARHRADQYFVPVLALALIVLWSEGCSPEPEAGAPGPWHEAEGHRWRALTSAGPGGVGFTRLSADHTGIDFENRLSPEAARERDHLLVGSGVALGDFDSDGLSDIYLARLEGPNVLYRNLGGWRFELVPDAGVDAPDRYSTGAVFADVDGDGHIDLFVTALGGPNALFRNLGDGTFEDVTGSVGLESDLGSTSATFADVDGDRDLDLYVANYKVESAADVLRPYERPDMGLIVEGSSGPEVAEPYREHFRVETRDGRQVAAEQADPDRLYLNDGTGNFTTVPWTGGAFSDWLGNPVDRDVDDFGLAAAFADVDSDGDADLYVANDFDDPDRLWINDGFGHFRAAGPIALRTSSHASMAVDFADVNRDGHMDFFVADMLSQDPARRLAQIPLHAALDKPIGGWRTRHQVGRNTLFLGRGDGTWTQAAELAGVDASEWSWGSAFGDIDLDGFEDLLVANGHGRDMRDGDAQQRIEALRGGITWADAKALFPNLPTENRAFRNRGDLTFEDVSEQWAFADGPDVSHGLALGDLDADGDLDVVVNRLGMPVAVLRNDAGEPRIAVRLVGSPPNTAAVGARVRLLGGAVAKQEREVRSGGLYLSGSDGVVSFAAGASSEMALEVSWPGSGVSVVAVEVGREYEIMETGALPGDATITGTGSAKADPGAQLFEDASELLGGQAHADVAYAGTARQPLVPFDLSRLGPGVTWADTDADGDPDLYVSTGRSGRPTLLRNDGLGFSAVVLAPDAPLDQTAALPEWSGGGTSLLVGQSSFEATSPDEARSAVGVVRIALPSGGPQAGEQATDDSPAVAGGGLSAVGPLAQADVDGDGDLDLFVGGRTVPAYYPLAATSRLFRREGGRLVEPAQGGPDHFADIGMVSGAVFTDLDDDGDPDLVLAVEWGAPLVLVNRGGSLVDATASWGVDTLVGLWKGVAAGDVDGDGDMDAVLTNHGLNTRLRASVARPLWVVHGDADRNGSWDVVLGQARRPGGPLHPIDRLERLWAGMPAISNRMSGFAEYSGATLDEVLGPGVESMFRTAAATLAHVVLLNHRGHFEVVELDVEAQLAPAHGVAVSDLDGDGYEDLVISQNLFATHGYEPRYDSGRGLAMLGDGNGGFRALPVSGISAYGDGRGTALADYDGDGRVDLAVGQHGGPTRLFRNVGARRGLRVRLVGPPDNPHVVGARLRMVYGESAPGPDGADQAVLGPAREVRSGSGYWSTHDPVQVMGLARPPTAVEVRWPDGRLERVPVEAGRGEVTVNWRVPS